MSWWCFGLRNPCAHVGAVDYVRRQGRFCRLDRFLHALRRPDHRPAPGAGAVQAPVPSVFLEPGDSGSVAGAFAAMLMVGCVENIFGVLAVAFSAIEYWLPLATSSCQDASLVCWRVCSCLFCHWGLLFQPLVRFAFRARVVAWPVSASRRC